MPTTQVAWRNRQPLPIVTSRYVQLLLTAKHGCLWPRYHDLLFWADQEPRCHELFLTITAPQACRQVLLLPHVFPLALHLRHVSRQNVCVFGQLGSRCLGLQG